MDKPFKEEVRRCPPCRNTGEEIIAGQGGNMHPKAPALLGGDRVMKRLVISFCTNIFILCYLKRYSFL